MGKCYRLVSCHRRALCLGYATNRSLHCVYPCVAHCVQLWLHAVRLKGVGMGPWNWFALEWCQFGVEVLPWLKLHLMTGLGACKQCCKVYNFLLSLELGATRLQGG